MDNEVVAKKSGRVVAIPQEYMQELINIFQALQVTQSQMQKIDSDFKAKHFEIMAILGLSPKEYGLQMDPQVGFKFVELETKSEASQSVKEEQNSVAELKVVKDIKDNKDLKDIKLSKKGN